MENGITVSNYWAFGIGAFASTATILVTVFTTLEYLPNQEELKRIEEVKKLRTPFIRTLKNFGIVLKEMPLNIKKPIPVMFFPLYAILCYL